MDSLKEIFTKLLEDIIKNKDIDEDTLSNCLDSIDLNNRTQLLEQTRGERNSTALHSSSGKGSSSIALLLLSGLPQFSRMTLLTLRDEDGLTALHLAVRAGHTQTVLVLIGNLLLEQRLDLLRVQDNSGDTVLHLASKSDRTSVMDVLLGFGEVSGYLDVLSLRNKEGNTFLHSAVSRFVSSPRKGISVLDCVLQRLPPFLQKHVLEITNILEKKAVEMATDYNNPMMAEYLNDLHSSALNKTGILLCNWETKTVFLLLNKLQYIE